MPKLSTALKTAPALDWIEREPPTERDGYAALLDALRAGAPAFLADLTPRPPLAGREFDRINTLHSTHSRETPPEAAERCREALDALRALAETEGAARFFMAGPEGYVPTWRRSAPRLGFRPQTHGPAPALQGSAKPGEAVVRCHVTGRLFAVPMGAPVPCLFYDYLDGTGGDPSSSEAHPEDRNPHSLDVHPALAARGVEAVLGALWGKLRGKVRGMAEDLNEAMMLASLIAGVEPDTVPGGEISRALVSHERVRLDGGGYEFAEVPAGWRDVGPSRL